MRLGCAIGLALDRADLGVLLVQLRRDGADLGIYTGGEDNTLCPAFGDVG